MSPQGIVRRIGGVGAAATLLVVCLFVPILWLKVAASTGIQLSPSRDPLGLLAAVGGIMGTIFVVGGLVVALAALITLSEIDARVDARVNLLLPELQQRADKQIQAYIGILDVLEIADWRVAEEQVANALALYPDLPRARSLLAKRLSNDVLLAFYNRRGPTKRPTGPALDLPGVQEALLWLDRAWQHHDRDDGLVAANMALMYGVLEDHKKMLKFLKEAIRENPERRAYLHQSSCLIVLAYGCLLASGDTLDHMEQLAQILGCRLPTPISDVRDSVPTMDDSLALMADGPRWWVVPREPSSGLSDLREYPQIIEIKVARSRLEKGLGPVNMCAFRTAGAEQLERFPPEGTGADVSRYDPIDEVLEILSERFLFLSIDEGIDLQIPVRRIG